jgi:uncharacterized membrane protein
MADSVVNSEDRDAREILHVILRPHRSLSPTGFWILMGVLAGVSFSAGTVFWLLGAWPVIGFMGLDVALTWRWSTSPSKRAMRARTNTSACT